MSKKVQGEDEQWEDLIHRRCKDAIRRTRQRKCSAETHQALAREATKLLRDQNYVCALCGRKLTYEYHKNSTASLDRIFSTVKKSPVREYCGYLNNMRWVCTECNHKTRSCHMPNAKYQVKCS
jgi:hypothetical protein